MDPRMKNLIEVSVDSIRIHMPTAQHLVILKEKEADRYLPIWIGSFEAQAIATKISGNTLGRPLTHDLMATAFSDLGISIKRIVVTRLADQVYYARLYVKQNGRDLDFDARPSDAIALAVRAECPIFVASEVMESAGIIPDVDDGALSLVLVAVELIGFRDDARGLHHLGGDEDRALDAHRERDRV